MALFQVARDIELCIADSLLLQEILGHLAEVACRRAVNSDIFVHVGVYYDAIIAYVVRVARIELAFIAWEAIVLPLNHTRIFLFKPT